MSDSTSVANPRDQLGELVVWTTFMFIMGFGHLILFVLGFFVPRIRRNALLMNLHFTFIVCGLTSPALQWAGHALDSHPPFKLCLFSAATTYSNGVITAGGALGLVTKVWTNVLSVYNPNSRVLKHIGYTPALFAYPYIISIPLMIISLVIGGRDRSIVLRSSPFYCTVQNDTLNYLSPAVGAITCITALTLSVWTTVLVMRSRWRMRSTTVALKNRQLIFRTQLFSVLVALGFVCGIVSLFLSFAVNINDILFAFTGVGGFIIFLLDKDVLNLFRCRRTATDSTASTTQRTQVSFTKHTTVRRDTGPDGVVTIASLGKEGMEELGLSKSGGRADQRDTFGIALQRLDNKPGMIPEEDESVEMPWTGKGKS